MLNDIVERPNIQNWAALIKNMLSNLGFFHVCVAQGVGDEKNFLSLFKQRINDYFLQNWYQRLNESSRALFYRQICNFQFQPYSDSCIEYLLVQNSHIFMLIYLKIYYVYTVRHKIFIRDIVCDYCSWVRIDLMQIIFDKFVRLVEDSLDLH